MFDYVIVGGGTAGCVLANRLSKNPNNRVALIEAGPPGSHPLINIPMGIIGLMRSKQFNWGYRTSPQEHMGHRELFWPRGRALGGSSAINAMVYTRGHPSDYDNWHSLGNYGWSYKDVLPYFKLSQHQTWGPTKFHGINGPLNVSDLKSPHEISHAFVRAAIESGFEHNSDFNGSDPIGFGMYQVTQKNGQRCSFSSAYLKDILNRDNLHIFTESLVTRLTFSGKTATGVEYTRFGKLQAIQAAKEIIVCSGTINTPQLLMLSGVGPLQTLKKQGIRIVQDLPGVGQNLQDHLDVMVVHRSISTKTLGLTAAQLLRSPKELYRYIFHKKGIFTSNAAESGGFLASQQGMDSPDIQFHFTPGLMNNHGLDLKFMRGHGYSTHVCNLKPKSRGFITLKDNNPESHPIINPNYLSAPEDIEVLVNGVKLTRRILSASAFDPWRSEEIFPGDGIYNNAQIRQFIRDRAETIYHPVGTCKMGIDDQAVVDPTLRIYGLNNIRIVDASIMPTLISGNTNAPVGMIAEKAADLILDEVRILPKHDHSEKNTQSHGLTSQPSSEKIADPV